MRYNVVNRLEFLEVHITPRSLSLLPGYTWIKMIHTTIHFLTSALNNVIYPSGNISNNKSCCFGQGFYQTNKELLIALI